MVIGLFASSCAALRRYAICQEPIPSQLPTQE